MCVSEIRVKRIRVKQGLGVFVIRKRKLRQNSLVMEDDAFFSGDKMSDIYVKE